MTASTYYRHTNTIISGLDKGHCSSSFNGNGNSELLYVLYMKASISEVGLN